MKKLMLAGLVAGFFVAGATTAFAGPTDSAMGSSEGHESEPYACPTAENPTPGGPAYDDEQDCADGAATYTVWEYDNEVDCGDTPDLAVFAGEPDDGTVVFTGGAHGSPTEGGGAEVCSDDENASPVQGRVLVDGSATGGLSVSVDGDGSNPVPGDGWVTLHVSEDGASVRCGDAGGARDSQAATESDAQDDCG